MATRFRLSWREDISRCRHADSRLVASEAGIFHDFHQAWITNLRDALNGGILPPDYYALGDQVAVNSATNPFAPDFPTSRFSESLDERRRFAEKQTLLAIRHAGDDDQIVAQIQIASTANKSSESAFESFVQSSVGILGKGIHLLLIDLVPLLAPVGCGVHDAIWRLIVGDDIDWTGGIGTAVVAYKAGPEMQAYVECAAVGDSLPDMPLFLTTEIYVPVPLETTYMSAFRGVPRRWKEVLEAP